MDRTCPNLASRTRSTKGQRVGKEGISHRNIQEAKSSCRGAGMETLDSAGISGKPEPDELPFGVHGKADVLWNISVV